MAPAMFPGQRNSPAHLPAICEVLAELMSITTQQLARQSTANIEELFDWH
jgi:TatD DNase family protein